jgi:tetratricopeptide (TPR) repeat protein
VLANLQKNKHSFFFPVLIVFVILSIAFADSEKTASNIDADELMNLGILYGMSGKHQEAIDAFKQTIRIRPDDASAHFALGLNYILKGNKSSALDEYKILKNLNKERANLLYNMIYP